MESRSGVARTGRSEFDHERLEVYRKAEEFRGLADRVIAQLHPSRAYVGDQLARASLSICLNIAEGAGEFRPKEKARFYRMAKRSASESAGLLRAAASYTTAPTSTLTQGRTQLLQITAMLTGLIQSIERRE